MARLGRTQGGTRGRSRERGRTGLDGFLDLQNASLAQIAPYDPSHHVHNMTMGTDMPSPRMLYVRLRQRMSELTRESVVEENRKIWAALRIAMGDGGLTGGAVV